VIRGLIPARPTGAVESAPEAWYVLAGPGTPPRAPVAVYTHQRGGWEAAVAFLDGLPADDLAAVTAGALAARFFAACAPPRPANSALEQLIDHFRGGAGRPAAFGREARAACEPGVLARQIREEDLGERPDGAADPEVHAAGAGRVSDPGGVPPRGRRRAERAAAPRGGGVGRPAAPGVRGDVTGDRTPRPTTEPAAEAG
jgi:hypothetical protein